MAVVRVNMAPRTLAELPTSSVRFVGKPVNRVEDPMLLTGRTEFIDNVTLPGMLHCAMLRSPYAHARIKSIDTSAAEKLPGVMAVLTGDDVAALDHSDPHLPGGLGHALPRGRKGPLRRADRRGRRGHQPVRR